MGQQADTVGSTSEQGDDKKQRWSTYGVGCCCIAKGQLCILSASHLINRLDNIDSKKGYRTETTNQLPMNALRKNEVQPDSAKATEQDDGHHEPS
jgi:hypothetical protein